MQQMRQQLRARYLLFLKPSSVSRLINRESELLKHKELKFHALICESSCLVILRGRLFES